MGIVGLDQENADFNLTSIKTVLTDTPDANHPMRCQAMIKLGDGTKNLNGNGGEFTIAVLVGGQTVQGSDLITFGTEVRSVVYTEEFIVPPGDEVLVKLKSPNADSDVDVTVYLYSVSKVSPSALAAVGSIGTVTPKRITTTGLSDISNDGLVGQIAVLNNNSSLKGQAREIVVSKNGTNPGESEMIEVDPIFPGTPSANDLLTIAKFK